MNPAERIADLRAKIAKLESLAADSATTEAESRTAQEAANRLRLELASLMRRTSQSGRPSSTDEHFRQSAPNATSSEAPQNQPDEGDESKSPPAQTNTRAPSNGIAALKLLAWTIAWLTLAVFTGGFGLLALPVIVIYYLIRRKRPQKAEPTREQAPRSANLGVLGNAAGWLVASIVISFAVRVAVKGLVTTGRDRRPISSSISNAEPLSGTPRDTRSEDAPPTPAPLPGATPSARVSPVDPSVHVTYVAKSSGFSAPTQLLAVVDGQTYELISESEELCLQLTDQRDFDSDGYQDAFVTHLLACGGNSAANRFFFYSYAGNGHFRRSESVGYSWEEPKIEKWKGRWSVQIVSNNEGANLFPPWEATERFVLDSGKLVRVEASERKHMLAVVDLRSDAFETGDPDQPRSITLDLNGDGAADQIIGRLWPRWGRMFWTVRFTRGLSYESNTACKRIGVLATSTNGARDLVCDQDSVFTWNGREYVGPD